jgi:hypothetical protein
MRESHDESSLKSSARGRSRKRTGTIGCELAGAITFGPSGTAYALNSEAEQGGWPAVDPILRKGGDVTEVLAAAEKICGASS